MWPNVQTLWREMPLFRYAAMFFAVGAIVLLGKFL